MKLGSIRVGMPWFSSVVIKTLCYYVWSETRIPQYTSPASRVVVLIQIGKFEYSCHDAVLSDSELICRCFMEKNTSLPPRYTSSILRRVPVFRFFFGRSLETNQKSAKLRFSTSLSTFQMNSNEFCSPLFQSSRVNGTKMYGFHNRLMTLSSVDSSLFSHWKWAFFSRFTWHLFFTYSFEFDERLWFCVSLHRQVVRARANFSLKSYRRRHLRYRFNSRAFGFYIISWLL